MINLKHFSVVAVAATLLLSPFARAQTTTPAAPEVPAAVAAPEAAQPPESPIVTEFKVLFGKITSKLATAGQDAPITEAVLADELKEFDALLAKHSADKSEEAAAVHVMKARLYLEVLDDSDKGIAVLKEVKSNYPDTEVAQNMDEIISSIEKQAAAVNLLAVGKPFPAINVTDLNGKPFTLESLKGKAVLIDFWATWCGPCIAELPHVQAAYEKYREKGFEILGVSLDRDRAKLDEFLTKNKLPWTHYFDEEGALAQEFGINAIPATFLVDKEGKIVAKDLRGDALEKELTKLLN
jgi:peroxiredoxin